MTKSKLLGSTSLTPVDRRIGERHPFSKLTDAQVDAIVDRWEAGGIGYAKLAKEYGVSKSTIQGYISGRRRGVAVTRRSTHRWV